MGFQYFLLIFRFVNIVRGDPLLDYAKRSFEQLPNWILENVDDNFTFTYPSSSSRGAFMDYHLQSQNITGNGMKNIRLVENTTFAGSLYTGLLDVTLTVTVDLELFAFYEASGTLFPYVDQLQFQSSGVWSTNVNLVMLQRHQVSMNVSIDGSITSEFSLRNFEPPQTSVSNFYFDNFLEDHLNQWYYPVAKEGFGKELEERVHRIFIYNRINNFRGFFEKVFKNINYSDIVGNQTLITA